LSPEVTVDAANAYSDQEAFLSNERNKGSFVKLLIDSLKSAGHIVYQAADDADTMVAQVAIQLAARKQVVSVIANDTDVLWLLLTHFSADTCDIFVHSTSSQHFSSIRAIICSLGESIVMVIHAIRGCDTTSALFGHGKVSVL
jgi:hypothetical protein